MHYEPFHHSVRLDKMMEILPYRLRESRHDKVIVPNSRRISSLDM